MSRNSRDERAERMAQAQKRESLRKALSEKAAQTSLAYTAELTSGTGKVLEAAAPLVFQGMCRREGIRVYFTETPKTDGRSIWLGPIDLTSPLAPVFVYGHGCHERHHVVHSDFKVLSDVPTDFVRLLANVFEDIRIDRLGAKDYEGYLLWRSALWKALEATGAAGWKDPALEPPALLGHALITHLSSTELGLEVARIPAQRMRARAEKMFGSETMEGLFDLIGQAFPLGSSRDSVNLALRVEAFLNDEAEAERKRSDALSAEALAAADDCSDEPSGTQGSLFGDEGEVLDQALPHESLAAYGHALMKIRSIEALKHVSETDLTENETAAVRGYLASSAYANDDPSLGDVRMEYARPEDYTRTWDIRADEMRKRFADCWAKTPGLRNAFQTALEHPLPSPFRHATSGFDLDDAKLAGLPAGEGAVFLRDMPVRGRELAVQILVDTSGSMDGDNITMAKVAAMRVLEAIRQHRGYAAQAALFPGATVKGMTPAARWSTPLSEAIAHVDFVDGYGSTPILQALFFSAVELEERREERKLVFVMTDGCFYGDAVEPMINVLRSRGIAVAMLGIGSMSTPMGDFTEKVGSAEDIPGAVVRLLRKISGMLRTGRRA